MTKPESMRQILHPYKADLAAVIRCKTDGRLIPQGQHQRQAWSELEARLRRLIPRLEADTEAAVTVKEGADFLAEGLRRATEKEDE